MSGSFLLDLGRWRAIFNSELSKLTGAVVLAGGQGTRLRVSFSGPKVLAPIAGIPFLRYLFTWLRNQGIRNVVLACGYQSERVSEATQSAFGLDLMLKYSVEERPLGTGGALHHAVSYLPEGNFLVLNGDSFFDLNLQALATTHETTGAAITMALCRVANSERYGTVELRDNGLVSGFREKAPSAQGATLINAGVYIFSSRLVAQFSPVRPLSLERDVLPQHVGVDLYGHVSEGYFIDIGIPEDLMRAQTELPVQISL